MFKRINNHKFALGLVTGGGLVAILLLFGQAIYDFAKCYQTGQCDRHAVKYESEDFPSSWWWRWTGDLVSSGDTLANWIMAIFTILVTFLVWRTLIATQKIATDTR